jgi:vancomycin resistance protein VanJ
MGWLVRYGFDVSFLLVCLASVLSFYGQKGWSFDLLACFRIPFIYAFVAYMVLYALRGAWQRVVVAFVLLGVQLSQWVFYLPAVSLVKPVPQAPVALTVMQCNVWKKNTQLPELMRTVTKQSPDVLALEEYTEPIHRALNTKLAALYPYHVIRLGEEMALYSRVPISNVKVWWTQHDHVLPSPNVESAIVARLAVGQTPVDVVVLHTLSPTQQHRYYHQQFHMAMLEQHNAELAPTAIVMGDMNATPWSWTLRRLIRQLNLLDSEEGTMVVPTWPRWWPLLPIDHVLYRGQLAVVKRTVLPPTGSDHSPVVVQFAHQAPTLPVIVD